MSSTNQQWVSMDNQQLDQMQKQWSTPPLIMQPAVQTSTNLTFTTTGDAPSYQREYEVSRIVKRSKGYFYVISVDATDDVYFRVWKGGLFPYLIAKMFKHFGRDIDGNKEAWNTVTKRTHLPATLGSAYDMVDEAIKEDIEDLEHDAYVKEMLKTDPENLKMIGSLERFQEGDVDGPEEDLNVGTSHSVGGTYANNVSVSVGGSASVASTASMAGGSITFDAPKVEIGDLSAVELIADKITLNGTDIEQTITDTVREAGEVLKAEILAQEETVANTP